MKKTLTIMMTAATALFGLSSCSDSNNNNSSSPAAPISTSDFANGIKYYTLSGETSITLSMPATQTPAEGEAAGSVVLSNLAVSIGSAPYTVTSATYEVEGGKATFTITGAENWGGDSTIDEAFCGAWGLALKEDQTTYSFGESDTTTVFKIVIEGGQATLSVPTINDAATVKSLGPVTYSVTVNKNEVSDPAPDGEEQEDGANANLKPAA